MKLTSQFKRAAGIAMMSMLALAGCTNKTQDAAEAADTKLRAALQEAAKATDPWIGFYALKDREEAIYKEHDNCSYDWTGVKNACVKVKAQDQVKEQRIRLLTLAIDQARPEAFAFLYAPNPDYRGDDEYTALRKASVKKLLAYADRANGSSADASALLRAGEVVAAGDSTILDTGRAAGYFARAWAAGATSAANSAALLFLSINDLRNAYMWSLRCTGDCKRDNRVQLEQLQAHLSPEAARQAQSKALDTSAVQLDSSGGQ